MAEVETQPPALPDYVLDANATLKDESASWRYGRATHYSNTRSVYEKSKTFFNASPFSGSILATKNQYLAKLSDTRTNIPSQPKAANHEAGSLPDLVEKLVKNWEIEASFKTNITDWRTIDHAKYIFAINGWQPQTAEHMLKVGTYNAIITPNEYYSPEHSDLASSYKTVKHMMPTFAWEVLEIYCRAAKGGV
jgi:hypothetical protein